LGRSNTSSASFNRTTREFRGFYGYDSDPIIVLAILSSATPVQKIITAEKGVTLDIESLSRDSQIQSKELYQWGQKEDSDVKDGWYSNDRAFVFDLTVLLQPPIGWLS
jgi:hypothetical protein